MADQAEPKKKQDSPYEDTVFETRMSWWSFSGSFMMAGLCVAAMAVGLVTHQPWGNLLALAAFALGSVVGSGPFVKRAALVAKVTSKRLVVSRGLVAVDTTSINLNRIEAIDVEQSIGQRMMGYGNVVVHGMGDTPIKLVNIADPKGFRDHAFKASDRNVQVI